MEHKCKICGENVVDNRHFYKSHKIGKQEYYEVYFPRCDLLTQEKIVFKDENSYFGRDFKTKLNLIKWLKLQDKGVARDYIASLYRQRIAAKGLTRAMGQAELRTSWIPAINVIELYFDTYDELCDLVGVENTLKNKEIKLREVTDEFIVAIDSREQRPLKFKCKTIPMKCVVGDYTALAEYHSNVFIDRKAPGDFLGTLSKGYDRFCREVELAKDLNSYIVVLVEHPLSKLMSFDHSYLGKFGKASPEFIFGNMRKMMVKYDNIQFVFVKNRTVASEVLVKILCLGESAKNIDLQLSIDKKRL